MSSRKTKTCECCGATFERHPKYDRAQWKRARFCSLRCAKTKPDRWVLCECGCGERVRPGRRFRRGHARGARVQKPVRFNRTIGRWVVATRDGSTEYWSRVVMEDKLGRPLRSGEVVHHVNEDKTDDRPENLELCADEGIV